MEKEYITLAKKQELEAELDDLIKNKRKEIASALEYAKSLGDLSENAEYHQAREDQAHLEDRIVEIENILKNAEIATPHKSDKVEVGTKVTVKRKGSKTEIVYTLVGSEESNIEQGFISNESPIGKSLLGKKVGEFATFNNPKGEEISYEVVKLN
jgi:transcription elongation factor GreA